MKWLARNIEEVKESGGSRFLRDKAPIIPETGDDDPMRLNPPDPAFDPPAIGGATSTKTTAFKLKSRSLAYITNQ